MKHLTDEQIADALDGAPTAAASEHLTGCVACASKARELQAVLREAAAVDVPEPSPVFWQHFIAQVNAAVDEAPPARSAWPRAAWAAAAIIVVGFIATFASWPGSVQQPVAEGPLPVLEPISIDIDDDQAWAVVRNLAADLHYEDVREAGVVPQPGALEREVATLSEDERALLVRLVEEDLGHRGTLETPKETR